MRQRYLERGGRCAPDGWGRYLFRDRVVAFHLEWDCGSERLPVLSEKAAAYEDFYFDREGGERTHVLWVADWEPRERRLRQALGQVGPDSHYVQHWTTSAELLAERGPLGPLWSHLGGGERLALSQLAGRPAGDLEVEGCLDKPGWWRRVTGGDEGR